MTVIKRAWTILALGAVIAANIACGNASGSGSPTGPSAGRSTAVITGRVNGMSSTLPIVAASDSFAPRAATSLHVTITGTDISSTVDGSGQFTLNGVPPGDVTLQFSGSGVSASITLTGITAGQTIHVEVTLNGRGGAHLDSETRDDDDDDLNEVKGAVTGLTGTCPALTFTIGTRTVKTTDTTRFEDGCAKIQNTARVEVKGTIGSDSVLTATRVELDD